MVPSARGALLAGAGLWLLAGAEALSPGDIAVIGIDARGTWETDRVALLFLAGLEAGARFRVTSRAVLADGRLAAEGGDSELEALHNIAPGTAITWTLSSTTLDLAVVGGEGILRLESSGDSVTIFEDSTPQDSRPDRYVFSLSTAGDAFGDSATATGRSELPLGLALNTTAVAVGAACAARYTGPTQGSRTALLSHVADASLWEVRTCGGANETEALDLEWTEPFDVTPDPPSPPAPPASPPSPPPLSPPTPSSAAGAGAGVATDAQPPASGGGSRSRSDSVDTLGPQRQGEAPPVPAGAPAPALVIGVVAGAVFVAVAAGVAVRLAFARRARPKPTVVWERRGPAPRAGGRPPAAEVSDEEPLRV